MIRNDKGDNSRGRSSNTSGGGWETVYTGFILIMLCFFIMLCSFSTIEKEKVENFVRSFVHAVDILKGGFGLHPEGESSRYSSDITARKGSFAPIFQNLVRVINDLGMQETVTFSLSSEGLVIRLSDTALFDLGVAEISPEAIPLLNKIGAIISETPYVVRIEGHTDNLPIHTKQFPSNWELSTARAVNVLRYFMETGKIMAGRLSAAGFGEFRPLFPNDSPAHRAKNRRVEIIFASEEHETTPKEMEK